MPDKPTYHPPQTPAFWFLLLERARDDGRFGDAERYLRELRRLGVKIEWRKAAVTKAEARP